MTTKYSLQKVPRTIEKCRLYHILDANIRNNLQETITDCFYVRDHRNGRGERDLGRMCFNWLADTHPVIFLKIFHHIPVYGRWDDLLYITNPQIVPYIYDFLSLQINRDYFNMTVGEPITTCAKWMPTEGKSFARHQKNRFTQLLHCMKMKPKEYRSRISILRKYLNIPEHHLCSGKLHLINEDTLTKGALKLYKSSLINKDPWTFRMEIASKKTRKKKSYTKYPDQYESILNNLKLDSI